MQSVFKMPLGAAVLAEVDAGPAGAGRGRLHRRQGPLPAPLADRRRLAGPHDLYASQELLVAAVSDSDNTAADVLMKRIGGPGAVTAWLARQGRRRAAGRPLRARAAARGATAWPRSAPPGRAPAFDAALRHRAAGTRRRGRCAPTCATRATRPRRAACWSSCPSWTPANCSRRPRPSGWWPSWPQSPRGPERLKAGFPKDAIFAHKIGTGGIDQGLTTAYNDVGIFTLADKRSYAVAAFLTGSTARTRPPAPPAGRPRPGDRAQRRIAARDIAALQPLRRPLRPLYGPKPKFARSACPSWQRSKSPTLSSTSTGTR